MAFLVVLKGVGETLPWLLFFVVVVLVQAVRCCEAAAFGNWKLESYPSRFGVTHPPPPLIITTALFQEKTNGVLVEATKWGSLTPESHAATTTTTSALEQFSSPEKRASIAKVTFQTMVFADTSNRQVTLDLNEASVVHNVEQFEEFKTIVGTFFINGLSSCRIGNRVVHPFEAHGFVRSLGFDGKGKLHFKTAIVETPLTQNERRFGLPLARGVMSSLGNPLVNALVPAQRDTANLSAVLWPPPGLQNTVVAPVLIVAGDNGTPFRVDPITLKTLGPLSDVIPELKDRPMLAHSRIDEARQRLILCSSKFDFSKGEKTMAQFWEFDVNFKLVATRTWETRFMVFHDWMITDNYYIVPKNPASFRWDNLPKFLMGLIPGVEIFDMDYSAVGELVLIPRHNEGLEAIECAAESFFNIFHFGPCYENKDTGAVVVYGSVFDKYSFGGEMGYDPVKQDFDPIRWSSSDGAPAPRLDRFVLNLRDGTVQERQRIPLFDKASSGDADIPVDMPTFNGDGVPCRYGYFLGGSRPEGWFPFRSVVKADLDNGTCNNWDAGDGRITSEPRFVPRLEPTSEDDGFVLSIVHSAADKACDLVIWDSHRFSAGPIATVALGELMPWSVHGSWIPGFVA